MDFLFFDPEQARELLDVAGWHQRAGDGIREREGMAFRFTAIVSNDSNFQLTATYVQAQLRRVGVDMMVQLREDVGGSIKRGEFQEAAIHFLTPP